MTLSPKARELIEASRQALRATPADRDRIEGLLRVRLGDDVLPPDGSSVAGASSVAPWPTIAGIVAGVCVVAGLTVVLLPDRTSTEPPAGDAIQRRAPAPATPPPIAATRPRLESESTATKAPVTSAPRAARAPQRRDRLAEEVALLSRAASALRAGRSAAALAALDEHERRFPTGALREERRAARAEALCALGQLQEGLAELAHLAAESPAAAHVRQLCQAKPQR